MPGHRLIRTAYVDLIMTYIEPVFLYANSPGEGRGPHPENPLVTVDHWSDTFNWAFNKIIGEEFDIINTEAILDEIEETLDGVFSGLDEIDNDIYDRMISRVIRGFDRRGPSDLLILKKNDTAILTGEQPGVLFFISNSSDDIDEVLSELRGRLSNISNVASDFGVELDLLHGERYAEQVSEWIDSDVIDREDFDNEFEELVHSNIVESFTRCIDDNVTLRFGEDDPEIFEYDLILHVSRRSRILIEVKDESHEEADLGKTKLIDRPRDKTNIMEKDKDEVAPPFRDRERTETFVLVRELDQEKFKQHKRKAERRDISLLKYDEEGNYIDDISNTFKKMVYSELP